MIEAGDIEAYNTREERRRMNAADDSPLLLRSPAIDSAISTMPLSELAKWRYGALLQASMLLPRDTEWCARSIAQIPTDMLSIDDLPGMVETLLFIEARTLSHPFAKA